ncbi:hypothetical protein GCM10010211_43490 [Streptomyces albospinus]|uniref:Uncharacterized protein n=1 Tax=Streptomyces albospinus TaxID=285515 RepID=A0ABQ2V8V4_9ACTN|nr:hypothetical protein GCM10010211_43490 [Streptomyces albospinus]
MNADIGARVPGHHAARRTECTLTAAGVDAFHASTRRYWLPEFEGSDLNLAGWTKKLTGKPTLTVGSVGLDGDFLRAFAGEGAGVGSIDNLLDRLERDGSILSPSAAPCSRTRSGRRRSWATASRSSSPTTRRR